MEQLVKDVEDYMLNLSVNSHRDRATPSSSLPPATKDHGDDDDIQLALALQLQFDALKTKSPAEQELTSDLGDDLSDIFASLKGKSPVGPTAAASSSVSEDARSRTKKSPLISTKKVNYFSKNWTAPRSGSNKVNVDGSTCIDTQESGFGGLVRDCRGEWLIGFTAHIGKSEILFAELLGILHGIRIAKTLGITSLVCESDSKEAVTLVNLDPHLSKSHKYGNLIYCINQLISSPGWDVAVVHILRDANRCADFLAKLGRHRGDKLSVWNDPHVGLLRHLAEDITGVKSRLPRHLHKEEECVNLFDLEDECVNLFDLKDECVNLFDLEDDCVNLFDLKGECVNLFDQKDECVNFFYQK